MTDQIDPRLTGAAVVTNPTLRGVATFNVADWIAEKDALIDQLKAERDAALAEVEGLRERLLWV